jgi:GntR family transcriptional regulator
MLLHINAGSGVPVYLQIEMQVKQAVAAGALTDGDALPSVRKLAVELRINPNTVARAYQELEHESVIRTVPGGGTYIAARNPGILKSEKLRRLRPLAKQLAIEAAQLRLAREEVLKLLQQELDELGGGSESTGNRNAISGQELSRRTCSRQP